jgi:hypothetical protein
VSVTLRQSAGVETQLRLGVPRGGTILIWPFVELASALSTSRRRSSSQFAEFLRSFILNGTSNIFPVLIRTSPLGDLYRILRRLGRSVRPSGYSFSLVDIEEDDLVPAIEDALRRCDLII